MCQSRGATRRMKRESVVVEAEKGILKSAEIVKDSDASGGRMVRLAKPSSRIVIGAKVAPGSYRLNMDLFGTNENAGSVEIDLGGRIAKQRASDHHIIHRAVGECPVVKAGSDGVVRFTIRPCGLGVCVDRIVLEPVADEETSVVEVKRTTGKGTVPKSGSATGAGSSVSVANVGFELVASAREGGGVYFGRRLEPKGRHVLHGAGQDPVTFAEYSRAMGKMKPLIYMYYMGMRLDGRERLRALEKKLSRAGHYVIPQIGLSLPVEEILKGELKKEMESVCDGLRGYRRPVYVRLGYEFNLNHNKHPEKFAEAWRVFSKVLRGKPGSDHVALAWCMTPDGDDGDFMAYYPGDEFVDWWSYDPFTPQHMTHKFTIRFVEAARERRYPVLIGESTPRWLSARQGELSWTVWFKRYFDQMEKHPHVKAFCYIAWDWAKLIQKSDSPYSLHWWGDARVWLDRYVFSKWKSELSKPCFVHSCDEKKILEMLGVTSLRRSS